MIQRSYESGVDNERNGESGPRNNNVQPANVKPFIRKEFPFPILSN
jgi:hypothetical protein